jgi:hypothetical protein
LQRKKRRSLCFNALGGVRRRFAGGFSYQVNYSFQKTLADSTQDTQQSVDPISLTQSETDRGRPATHTINANANIELPFGRGHRWLNKGWANKIFSGFQIRTS